MDQTIYQRVELPNGQAVYVEATTAGTNQEKDVSSITSTFSEITGPLEGVATALSATIAKVQPKKASVEFGLEVGLEAGKLTALLVKGTGKANLKVTMHWES
jgi:hypothetical protein